MNLDLDIFAGLLGIFEEVYNYFLELMNRILIALGKEPQEKLDDAVKDIIGK